MLLAGVAEMIRIDVTQRDDANVFSTRGRTEVAAAHSANADACDVQRLDWT